MPKLLRIVPSEDRLKKYDAIFEGGKVVSFGGRRENGIPYDDYTTTGDRMKRALYLARHRVGEDWNDPTSAGALSRWLLWGDSRSLATNLASFRRRFGV
jgi:hypothetical protein